MPGAPGRPVPVLPGEELSRPERRTPGWASSSALERLWPWADAEELDRRGALANDISDAITDELTTLREPPPPVCAPGVALSGGDSDGVWGVLTDRSRQAHTRLSDGGRKGAELHEDTST